MSGDWTPSWAVFGQSNGGCIDPFCPCHADGSIPEVWQHMRKTEVSERTYLVIE